MRAEAGLDAASDDAGFRKLAADSRSAFVSPPEHTRCPVSTRRRKDRLYGCVELSMEP